MDGKYQSVFKPPVYSRAATAAEVAATLPLCATIASEFLYPEPIAVSLAPRTATLWLPYPASVGSVSVDQLIGGSPAPPDHVLGAASR